MASDLEEEDPAEENPDDDPDNEDQEKDACVGAGVGRALAIEKNCQESEASVENKGQYGTKHSTDSSDS